MNELGTLGSDHEACFTFELVLNIHEKRPAEGVALLGPHPAQELFDDVRIEGDERLRSFLSGEHKGWIRGGEKRIGIFAHLLIARIREGPLGPIFRR